ncbi:MAG: amino acid ABC transporter permease [Chloroflexi bacterium]|nr:amino acid ABC transporter permease [Chloroflexota bacterium]
MNQPDTVLPPLTERSGILRWLRHNLFGTWLDGLLTVFGLLLIYLAVKGLLTWIFTIAEWEVVLANLRLFMIGQFPLEQAPRLWVGLGFLLFLTGNSLAIWDKRSYVAATLVLAFPLFLAFLPFNSANRQWLVFLTATGAIGWGLGFSNPQALKKTIVAGWIISLPILVLLTRGFTETDGVGVMAIVGTNLWGGLLLTFLLTVVANIFSFPLGLFLALGRRSELPIIRWFSVGYIELVRGVPLITILFMAQLMLPLFVPGGMDIDRVLRAMVGMTLFSAAYLAENVRGGLQAIPKGQFEAAHALGLSGAKTMIFVILPQALRLIIPILVGQFISVFKDTALVAIVGLFDLLGIARTVLSQPEFIGLHREVYAFVSLLYWVLSYAMSYISQRLETSLGIGTR